MTTDAEKVKDLPPATDGTNQTFTISVPKTWNTLDNTRYTFTLLVCHDPNGSFHGASVKYTYTSAGAYALSFRLAERISSLRERQALGGVPS
jgi:hypothetical protein